MSRLGGALRLALPGWLVARAIAAAALLAVVVAWGGLAQLPQTAQSPDAPDASGLWVWDAGWYRAIAERGYDGLPQAVRFFPLLPLLGRAGGWLLGGHAALALVLLCNAAALGYAALLVRLVQREVDDAAAARRAAWLAALAPGAGVLVLAYTEPVAGALAAGFFLAIRSGTGRSLGVAAALGLLSGLARPTGVLLAAPALVEALRVRPRSPRSAALWVIVVASPLGGTALYCAWTWVAYGDPLLPYTVQTDPRNRGGLAVDPRAHLFTTTPAGLDWRLQLLLLVVALVLLVVAARRLPASYGVWSALTVAAAMTSAEGHSLPRYLAGTFPLLLAAALVLRNRSWRPVLGVCILFHAYVALAGYAAWLVL